MMEVLAQTKALLESARINCVLFGNVPTGIFNHALYLLARRLGIRTFVLKRLLFESATDLSLLIPSIEEGAPDVEQAYQRALAEAGEAPPGGVPLPDDMCEHLRQIRQSRTQSRDCLRGFHHRLPQRSPDRRRNRSPSSANDWRRFSCSGMASIGRAKPMPTVPYPKQRGLGMSLQN